MKRTALLFDLDGTLVDSANDLQAALNEVLREAGAAPLELAEVRRMIGDGVPALVKRGLAARGIEESALPAMLARFNAIYEADPVARTRPYPGVADTLAVLAGEGRRLAVCTNKPEAAACIVLERLGLAGYFAAVVGGDTLAVRKPHPGHLLAALARLGARPAEAVMIGDNENDAAAARAAGLPVILARYGYPRLPLAEIAADREIDAFAELPRALAELDG